MANPAPTINQINAFNATQGTTIDFNIIGGTELVRSNRIYIYDLSDNSLICTHLYVSTEPIHELPPNTSTSIVYESGKSSADFTNNTQYYAQIQTYTDTNGTQGASGLSVAKLFWCLPTPTLTLSTIPTTISTTSYNVSATYTSNTSGSATNEIQEFQFNLYSAIGALLQTSGVVLYGEGVELSYNFSGLEVNSTYYVTLDVTTTQGMNVSVQSDTFTVSIDTPTMGSASVVNNGCDGYISVTSNLSSEYEHEESAEVGEIMSFTTDSVNDITELDVDFEPIQDGTPWMSAQDTEPYMFRAVPTQTEDFGHESDTIVGGTVAWNQLVQNGDFEDTSEWSANYGNISVADNVLTYTVTSLGTEIYFNYIKQPAKPNVPAHHKVLVCFDIYPAHSKNVYAYLLNYAGNPTARFEVVSGKWNTYAKIMENGTASTKEFQIALNIQESTGYNVGEQDRIRNFCIFDLTAMFGSTIADYIYSLERANAGAGVAWFKKYFPKPYYAYNAGQLISVKTSAHQMVGFNQLDPANTKVGGAYNPTVGNTINLDSTGATYTGTNPIEINVTKAWYGCCLISEPLVAGQQYEVAFKTSALNTADKRISQYLIDADNRVITSPYNLVGNSGDNITRTFTPTESGLRCAVTILSTSAQKITVTDPCIHLRWDGERDGEYEAYVKHSYPLDSSLTLRGIPKLDASNNLYYDGDTYASDGTVTRKYGIVDLGTLNWSRNTTNQYFASLPTAGTQYTANQICTKYLASARGAYDGNNDKVITVTGSNVWVRDTAYPSATGAEFKTAMSGVYLVYELATPTTETADPYTNPQIVDDFGTEEYVGSPIPVGHKTTYQRICPITGWTGCEVDVAGVNLWDEEWALGYWNYQNNGAFVANNNFFACKNKIPVKPSTTYFWQSPLVVREMLFYDENGDYIRREPKAASVPPVTFTTDVNCHYVTFYYGGVYGNTYNHDISINYPSTDTTYHAYNGTTYPVSWQTEAGTVYGGTVDLVTGVLTVDRAMVDLGIATWYYVSAQDCFYTYKVREYTKQSPNLVCSNYPYVGIYADLVDKSCGYIYGNAICIRDSSFNQDASAFKTAMNGVQLVYELATPQTYQLTPQEIETLVGQNNLWHDTNGEMTIMYQLPITDLLVKRKDMSQVGSQWLTLHSVPIEQASDMDFTYIDFLNQYGKKYQYALVPVLAQDQSGVIVQIEGGYTTSDTIDSIFDGVYIADQTNVERVKAGVGYGNIDMNQGVGSITPIGSKYPIVITNSQNQYHNGSIRGTIVPNDFYSNGNLSRIDMVNKRDELEQFLTNKRAKIIKDWNGKMWLVMIMSNVSCTFDDNYGMGIVSFSADWLEVGDPTNQQDLYNAGLINVGGV